VWRGRPRRQLQSLGSPRVDTLRALLMSTESLILITWPKNDRYNVSEFFQWMSFLRRSLFHRHSLSVYYRPTCNLCIGFLHVDVCTEAFSELATRLGRWTKICWTLRCQRLFTGRLVFLSHIPKKYLSLRSPDYILSQLESAHVKVKVKAELIKPSARTRPWATGRQFPYWITQCYLPPDTSERAPP